MNLDQIPKRGFYVLKDNPKYFGQKEILFYSGNVLGPNKYTRNHLVSTTGKLSGFQDWSQATQNQMNFQIMNSEFDFYSSWEDIPKNLNVPFLDVAVPYVKVKGNKLHRSEYFKMFIIQDFLKENGLDYTQMSDEAILIVIKRYKGWIQQGFPKSLAKILQKIISENPKV